jgi:hypothetical protein
MRRCKRAYISTSKEMGIVLNNLSFESHRIEYKLKLTDTLEKEVVASL